MMLDIEPVWVTSDQHWGHKNIGRYQDRPMGHEDLMIKLWHQHVEPDDVVLHLGDIVVFPRAEDRPRWADTIACLPGQKLLVLGNHDGFKQEWYEDAGFTVLGRGIEPIWWTNSETEQLVAFTHEPEIVRFGWDVNVHGHIHSNTHRHAPSGNYINVSVEVTGYAPARLMDVLGGRAGQHSSF